MRDETEDEVIAVLCSDIHLSLKPPRARRKEEDWFSAMQDTLRQVEEVALKYDVPILCSGDVFDHWRAEPELINFALCHLPKMVAVPGQHDLPLHQIDAVKRSAFWTMVLADRIIPALHGSPVILEDVVVHGFPWGSKVVPHKKKTKKMPVALCHEYVWTDTHLYPGAPEEKNIKKYDGLVDGYGAVVFGDNHKGFLARVGDVPLFNCGTLMRRKSNEKTYRPMIGLLCKSGIILRHKLKTGRESFITLEEEEDGRRKQLKAHDLEDFINGLSDLQMHSFDFMEAIKRAMEKKQVTDGVRKLILQSLEREE